MSKKPYNQQKLTNNVSMPRRWSPQARTTRSNDIRFQQFPFQLPTNRSRGLGILCHCRWKISTRAFKRIMPGHSVALRFPRASALTQSRHWETEYLSAIHAGKSISTQIMNLFLTKQYCYCEIQMIGAEYVKSFMSYLSFAVVFQFVLHQNHI